MSEIKGIERIFKRAKKLSKDAKEAQRPLRAASVLMLGSIERTFKAQGRPERWKKLADSTLAARRTGKGKGSAQILIDRARLKNSHSYRLTGDSAEIGTNVIYAKRQHFGYPKGEGRGHSETPARPWLMFQPEDVRDIGEIFSRHYRS